MSTGGAGTGPEDIGRLADEVFDLIDAAAAGADVDAKLQETLADAGYAPLDDDRARVYAAMRDNPSRVAATLDGYEITVGPPTGGGPPVLGLLCRREHRDDCGDVSGPRLIIPAIPADPGVERATLILNPDLARESGDPLDRILAFATQDGMLLSRLVEDALEHDTDAHG